MVTLHINGSTIRLISRRNHIYLGTSSTTSSVADVLDIRQATIREERERRGTAMLGVFFGGGTLDTLRSSKKMTSKVPRTSMSPRMDINPSSSGDRTCKASPTTIHANPSLLPLTLPPSLRCLTTTIRRLFLSLDHCIVDSFHRPDYLSPALVTFDS